MGLNPLVARNLTFLGGKVRLNRICPVDGLEFVFLGLSSIFAAREASGLANRGRSLGIVRDCRSNFGKNSSPHCRRN